jgi:DNA-binding transcriptional LysR family regulator
LKQIDNLPGLFAFERIVARGSLTAAAAELGVSLAVVSKRLASLERGMGVRLIDRSTRRLSATDAGKLLYAHAVRVVTELANASDALARQRREISGLLKITAPYSFGRRRLVPLLGQFSLQHPQLRIHLHLSDEVMDLIAGGFDIAIRYGALRDSSMVARELVQNRRVLCASPDYLRRFGQPQRLSDLLRHRCIVSGPAPLSEWRFGNQRRSGSARIAGHIVCNDGEAAHAMALEGLGIVLKSIWDVADDLKSERLVQILPKHAVAEAPINAVYLRGHNRVPRVRAFIDFLGERLGRAAQV